MIIIVSDKNKRCQQVAAAVVQPENQKDPVAEETMEST